MSRVIATIILSLFFSSVVAQQGRQYSFRHFSVANGLASNTVSSVIQDKEGYIWMATVNGLQRYDGNGFITFRTHQSNPHSIPSNHIISLYIDSKNNLWLIADNNRLGIFDTKKFIFKEVENPSEKRRYYIPQHLQELPAGELLLINSDYGVFQYDEKKNVFVPANNILPHPEKWKPNQIIWDTIGKRYWISCDSGLVQYNPATKHENYRGHNIDHDPVIQSFGNEITTRGIFTDRRGDVFFVYWVPRTAGPFLCRYNRRLNKAEKFSLFKELQLAYHEIDGLLLQRNGRLWVYGSPFFAEWADHPNPFKSIPNEYRDEQSIKFDVAYHSFEDRENNIWIATDNGIYLFNPDAQIFNAYNLITPERKLAIDPTAQAVVETKDGKIIAGTWGQGLYYYDQNLNPLPIPSGLKPKGFYLSVWDMAIHSKTGVLWIVQQDGNIALYDSKTNKLLEIDPEIFGNSTIRQIKEDNEGNLWFGTQSGKLIKWDYKKSGNDPGKGYELVLQTGLVHKILKDNKGFLWIATLGRGLIKMDPKTELVLKNYTTEGKEGEKLFMDSPGDIIQYNDSTMIISAACINILNTNTNKVSFISTENGLPSNTTESVLSDNRGIIWAGMTNGICRLNLDKKIVTYYDRRDGIAFDRFNMTGAKKLADGRLIFFTDHNLLVFDPETFIQQNLPPKPYITSFKLAGQPLSLDSIRDAGRAVLKYNNTSISIDFSALSYLQQRKLHFYYMLEGLDKNWIHADRPIEAIYNYLPPGNFVFKVKSENADGVTSKEIAAIPIFVRSPIWKTWWFYALIALLIILVLYTIDHERMLKIRSLQQLRRQIVTNLHSEVSYTLNNINVLSEIAKIKADKNVEQSKEFIDQISGKSRNMIESMEDMLWSIDPQNDSMRKTLLRMKELTDGLSTSNNVDIDLIVDHKVQKLELNMKLRHEFFLFYKEAMNFLVQTTPCNQIFVNINGSKSNLRLEILSECGGTTDDLKRRFRKLVQKRVEALSGMMDIIADSKSFSVALYVKGAKV